MDCYTKQWPSDYMSSKGSASWDYAMGLDMSVSPGTVIRPDMPLGSGPARSAETVADPILMKQQGVPAGSCPWLTPKRPRCPETIVETENGGGSSGNCQSMSLCQTSGKCGRVPSCCMPGKCGEMPDCCIPEKCGGMPDCCIPEKCGGMPDCCMPEKSREMPARHMPQKSREMPARHMPNICPGKRTGAVPLNCPNMSTSPAFIKCPEGKAGIDSAVSPGMPAPAPCPPENIDLFTVGMAYVPWQCWQQVYPIDTAMSMGTIFPDLYKPFTMGGCRDDRI